MANDNKDNKLDLEILDNVAGGGGNLPRFEEQPNDPIPYMEDVVVQYGSGAQQQAVNQLTSDKKKQAFQIRRT